MHSVNNNNFIKAYDLTPIIMSEANNISKLKKLLESNYIIEKGTATCNGFRC